MKPTIKLTPDGAQSCSATSRGVYHPRFDRARVDRDEPAAEYHVAEELRHHPPARDARRDSYRTPKATGSGKSASQRATGTPLGRKYTSHTRRRRRAPLACESSPNLEIGGYVLGDCAYHQDRNLTAHTSQLDIPPQKGP